MLKPLILLVDDDRAVLDALEATVVPAFEEVARVEAYDRPEDVLASVPRWAEEKRQIAVAIVDQKMPAMTGVELLTRLRTDASASMRAILLTGYAGLDSAIAAKNDAGVEKYLEKPWVPRRLVAVTREAFINWARETASLRRYLLREVVSESERLRYAAIRKTVYRLAPHTAHLVEDGDPELDQDAHDARSRHLGLFLEDGEGAPQLVGGLRVVLQPPFPIAEMFGPDSALPSLIESLRLDGRRVGEPGRLVLLPEHRSRGTGHQVIEGSVGFFFFFFCNIDTALLSCHPVHRVFYAPLGFKLIPGVAPLGDPVPAVAMIGRHEEVPVSARPRLDELAERMRRTGFACRCATFPACLGGPYGSGEFREVDGFCPLNVQVAWAADS